MDKKTKKVVRKKPRAPNRNNDMNFSDRIREAVNELKRYDSPEVLREVNQISTPVSCPAYPIIQRYRKAMSLAKAMHNSEENSKPKQPSYDLNPTPAPFKSPRKPRKDETLLYPKEISLAAYLKTNTRNQMNSLNAKPALHQKPNQSEPKKRRNRSCQKSPRNATAEVSNKNRRLPNQIDKRNYPNHQKENNIRYATILPVHETINKKKYCQRQKHPANSAIGHCPGCVKTNKPNVNQGFKQKTKKKRIIPPNNKPNTLTYFVNPGNISLHPNSEKLAKRIEETVPMKPKKRKKITVKRVPIVPNLQFRRGGTSTDINWHLADVRAFEPGKSNTRSNISTEKEADALKPRPSLSAHRAPTVIPPGSPGEVSYRMCKQCPLRQLISKIDPAVGRDRKSYPVVAFTCCRRPPNVRTVATST